MEKTWLRRMPRPGSISAAIAATAALTLSGVAAAPQFTEAEIFVELNDTDGDLGLHASIDGGPWTALEIEGPFGRTLLQILSRGALNRQGLTQLAFESAEPPFDELPPAEFFRRFPEGRYEIEGRTQSGGEMVGRAILSHVLAAPPDNVRIDGLPAADSCDAASLPRAVPPVLVEWDPVTRSHPEIGRQGRVSIARYQLFVEGGATTLSLDLPPAVTRFEVPADITPAAQTYKFEIIARTTRGNNTAIESCFVVD